MKLRIVAVGGRPPAWVEAACEEFRRRFPPHCPLELSIIATPRRGRNPDIARLREQEYRSMAARVPAGAAVVALAESGRAMTTAQLAQQLDRWMQAGRDVAFLIGGPDGLAPAALNAAGQRWSLSALTLPHALVRIIVAEQLYRAFCILSDHPYHRGH